MKKRVAIFCLCLLFLTALPANAGKGQYRGLFVTLIQDPPVLSSRQEIAKLIDYAKKIRAKVLFVQIYRANQAWFPSKVGDPSPYDAAVRKLGEDPFKLLIHDAHKAGIEVHAWLNMLSLSQNKDAPLLKKYGPEILTRNLKPKKILKDYQIDSQYFLEPGDLRVRKELVAMVEEIIRAYPDLDGVQFDYIRYPDSNPHYGYTKMNVERFKKSAGVQAIEDKSMIWKDWKRGQVTELLKELVRKARELKPDIQVSATGCMPFARAYEEAFQDWPSWADEGIVDFVTVMNYSTDPKEYERWIKNAKTKVKDFSRINIGLGAYKSSGSRETFVQEYQTCQSSGAGACVVFHYNSLLHKPEISDLLFFPSKR